MTTRLRLGAAAILVALLVLARGATAQGSPRVTGVAPTAAKAGDSVTVLGENLTKNNVVAVYLSDSSTDYKVTVVEQTTEKIIIKVPRLKPRDYNVSIQVRNDILIQPVRLSVQE